MERYSHTLVRLAISGTDIGCRHTSASDIDFAECVEWAAYPILGFKVSRSQAFAGTVGKARVATPLRLPVRQAQVRLGIRCSRRTIRDGIRDDELEAEVSEDGTSSTSA